MFTHDCYCNLCQRYIASDLVVHSIIEAENFFVETAKLITTIGPSSIESDNSIKRCETWGDQIFSHFRAIGSDKILVFKITTLDEAEQYSPQARIFKRNLLGSR